jgi:GntR family transcriptional regulator
MNISLSKKSELPLHEQLTEQIVFLIMTGKLRPGHQVPSVRALARRFAIHHNTVSKAYQALVRREWLVRRKGSRLCVVASKSSQAQIPQDLEELINQTMEKAHEMGYSLRALREAARARLLVLPDRFLVVEKEPALGRIIQSELRESLRVAIDLCTPEELLKAPELAVGAELLVPDHAVDSFKPLVPQNRPPLPLKFREPDDQIKFVRDLTEPSIIAVVSVSPTFLRTARSLLAAAIGGRHTLEEILVGRRNRLVLRGIDYAFCDTLALPVVKCRHKIQYRLVAAESLEDLASTLEIPLSRSNVLRKR